MTFEFTDKQWFTDTETYPNLFTIAARNAETRQLVKISAYKNEGWDKVLHFLRGMEKNEHWYLGFGWRNYDAQLVQYILDQGKAITNEKVKKMSDQIIVKDEKPYFQNQIRTRFIDVSTMHHWDKSKSASLKFLEFTQREPRISDLPYDINKNIPSTSGVKKVEDYCVDDITFTEKMYKHPVSLDMLGRRTEMEEENGWLIYSLPDSSIGEDGVLKKYCNKTGKKIGGVRKLRTHRKEVNLGDLILPEISFSSDEMTSILNWARERVHKIGTDGPSKKVEVFGLEYGFGLGGMHACDPGYYRSTKSHIIMDIDVGSFYPRFMSQWNVYPEHLGPELSQLIEDLYEERKQYPKGSTINGNIKIELVSIYGKMGSKYSFLYDHAAKYKVTINGQFLIMMLSEWVAPYGKLIQVNTDGLTILIPRENHKKVKAICEKWEKFSRLGLEYEYYRKLVMRDVNNYIAIKADHSAKRKGAWATLEDLKTEPHKNSSAMIIPEAITQWVEKDIPVEQTISTAQNIYDFLYGLKGGSDFVYTSWHTTREGRITRDIHRERAVRYYVATQGSWLHKNYSDFRIDAIEKSHPVQMLMDVKYDSILAYQDLNKEYYIQKAREDIAKAKPYTP